MNDGDWDPCEKKVETAGIKLPGISYLQMTWNLHNAYRTFACAVKLWPFLWHCARCALVSRSDSKLAKLDLMIMISWKKSTNSFWMTEWGDIHIVLKTDTSAEWSCSHGLPRAPVFGSEKYLRIIYMPPSPPHVQNHVSPHAIITSDDWLKNRPLSIAETLTLLSLTSLLKECQPLTTSTKPQLEKRPSVWERPHPQKQFVSSKSQSVIFLVSKPKCQSQECDIFGFKTGFETKI